MITAITKRNTLAPTATPTTALISGSAVSDFNSTKRKLLYILKKPNKSEESDKKQTLVFAMAKNLKML